MKFPPKYAARPLTFLMGQGLNGADNHFIHFFNSPVNTFIFILLDIRRFIIILALQFAGPLSRPHPLIIAYGERLYSGN